MHVYSQPFFYSLIESIIRNLPRITGSYVTCQIPGFEFAYMRLVVIVLLVVVVVVVNWQCQHMGADTTNSLTEVRGNISRASLPTAIYHETR